MKKILVFLTVLMTSLGLMVKVARAAETVCFYLSQTSDTGSCLRAENGICPVRDGYYNPIGEYTGANISEAQTKCINDIDLNSYTYFSYCGGENFLVFNTCRRVPKSVTTKEGCPKGYQLITPQNTADNCDKEIDYIGKAPIWCLYQPERQGDPYRCDQRSESMPCPNRLMGNQYYGVYVLKGEFSSREYPDAAAECEKEKTALAAKDSERWLWCGIRYYGETGNAVTCQAIAKSELIDGKCPSNQTGPYTSEEECQTKTGESILDGKKRGCCIVVTTPASHSRHLYECNCATVLDANGQCPPLNGQSRYPYEREQDCAAAETAVNPSTDPSKEVPSFTLPTKVSHLGSDTLDDMNPLKLSTIFSDPANRNPGFIISRLLETVIFPLMAFLLFVMLVWGGYKITNGSLMGNQSSVELGRRRITAAVIGFLLLFASYWLWSMVERAFGLS